MNQSSLTSVLQPRNWNPQLETRTWNLKLGTDSERTADHRRPTTIAPEPCKKVPSLTSTPINAHPQEWGSCERETSLAEEMYIGKNGANPGRLAIG